jgi:hypothetical protein
MGLTPNKHADVAVKRDVLRMAHDFADLAATGDVYRTRLPPGEPWALRTWRTLRHGKRVECINSYGDPPSANILIYLISYRAVVRLASS